MSLLKRTNMKTIDIITPCWNHSKETIECIESIKKNTTIPVRWIYINNGSFNKEHKAVIKSIKTLKIPYIVIMNEENLGFVKATNQGLRASESEFVVLLNNDTVVCKEWVEEMIRVMNENERFGIVGCLTENSAYQGIEQMSVLIGEEVPKNPEYIYNKYKGKYIARNVLSFQCVLLRKKMIDEIGLLDERFGLGLGDDDYYCAVAKHHGWKIALSLGGFIYHKRRTSFKDIPNYKKAQEKNIKLLRTLKNNLSR